MRRFDPARPDLYLNAIGVFLILILLSNPAGSMEAWCKRILWLQPDRTQKG